MTPREEDASRAFGKMIRSRRRAMGLRQEDLALTTGVGRRFIIELEAGKPTCYLGHALLVAQALDIAFSPPEAAADDLELPDTEPDDGNSPRIL